MIYRLIVTGNSFSSRFIVCCVGYAIRSRGAVSVALRGIRERLERSRGERRKGSMPGATDDAFRLWVVLRPLCLHCYCTWGYDSHANREESESGAAWSLA